VIENAFLYPLYWKLKVWTFVRSNAWNGVVEVNLIDYPSLTGGSTPSDGYVVSDIDKDSLDRIYKFANKLTSVCFVMTRA
jgi:hypothetical protein